MTWAVVWLLEHEKGRPWQDGQPSNNAMSTDIVPDLEHFARRLIQDAMNDGRRIWWLKRALDFENAKPVPGEFHGQATPKQLSERWRWLDEIARACRAKAEIVGIDYELEDVLGEVA